MTKAVRGAAGIARNVKEEIISGTGMLVNEILEKNGIEIESIISIIFSITSDLSAMNPAAALRAYSGMFGDVPLFCCAEPDCDGAMERVVRVLVTYNTEESAKPVPVYRNGAERLRPDLG